MGALMSAAGLSVATDLDGLMDWVSHDLFDVTRARSSAHAHALACCPPLAALKSPALRPSVEGLCTFVQHARTMEPAFDTHLLRSPIPRSVRKCPLTWQVLACRL